MGKDVYGDVTYIKAYAASDSNSTYTLEGSSPVDADGQTYEAEYASLFGASTDTQASVNQKSLRLLRSGVCRQAGSRWRRRYLLC